MSSDVVERTFASLEIGEESSLERTISPEDVDAFAKISGDHSPLHIDEAYARSTEFGARVVHGMLLGSYVSALIGMQLPGKSALLVKETLEFKKPVFIGSTVIVTGKVVSKSEATKLIEVVVTIKCEDQIVVEGSVIVKVRDYI